MELVAKAFFHVGFKMVCSVREGWGEHWQIFARGGGTVIWILSRGGTRVIVGDVFIGNGGDRELLRFCLGSAEKKAYERTRMSTPEIFADYEMMGV